MARKKRIDGHTVYICDECGLGYLDRKTAQECEDWCRKTGTCSIEITKKAVYSPDPFSKLLVARRRG